MYALVQIRANWTFCFTAMTTKNMDEELLYFQTHTGYRNYKDRKDRLQKTVDFIRVKFDLLRAENLMAVLDMHGPGK